MRVSVRTQTGQNPPAHQFHRGRTSAGVAHVGFRIMHHHGISLFNQIHLVRIDINTVSEKRLFAQDAVIHKAVHNTFAVMSETMVQILNSFRHMNVVSDTVRLICRRQFKCLVGNRKLGMHAHHSRDHSRIVF